MIAANLVQITEEIARLVEAELARRGIAVVRTNGEADRACHVGVAVLDADRELPLDQFSDRLLAPAAVALANMMQPRAKNGVLYTAHYEVGGSLPILFLIDGNLPLSLGVGMHRSYPSETDEPRTCYVFGIGFADRDPFQFPRYKCHKEVRAAKINLLIGEREGVRLNFEDGYPPVHVSAEWLEKHGAGAGGYYVVYDDGYTSFSPAKAFEEGYTRIS